MKKPTKIKPGQQELTSAQKRYAVWFAQERIKNQLSCDPINEKTAEDLLRKAYEVANVKFPKKVLWVDSPNELLDSVGASVWASVGASVWASVGASVWASVGASVRDSVRDSVGDSVRAYYDSEPLSFYYYFNELLEENNLRFLFLFNEMVSGYYLGSEKVVIVRKPIRLERDENGRLHSESGKSIEYKNGWGFYALFGVRFEETDKKLWSKIIARRLTFKECMQIKNIEHRIIALKYIGTDKLLEESNAELIDKVRGYELYEVKEIFPSTQYFLKYSCPSTKRVYISGIDPKVGVQKDAIKALKWKFYLDDNEGGEFDYES